MGILLFFLISLLNFSNLVSSQTYEKFYAEILTSRGKDFCDCSECPEYFNCTSNYIWIDSSLDSSQPGIT
jgi:hypothetical protein